MSQQVTLTIKATHSARIAMHAIASITCGFPLAAAQASHPPQLGPAGIATTMFLLNLFVFLWMQLLRVDIANGTLTYRRMLRAPQSIELSRVTDARIEFDRRSPDGITRPMVSLVIYGQDRIPVMINAKMFCRHDIKKVQAIVLGAAHAPRPKVNSPDATQSPRSA